MIGKLVFPAVFVLAGLAGCSRVPAGTFLLPASQGPAMAKQCSRQPIIADGYWQVTARQAVLLDGKLRALLAQPSQRELAALLGPRSRSNRQLIGYTRMGKRHVYANFYPARDPARAALGNTEATRAVVACDGGPDFWSATLDLQTGDIASIDSNGMIGGGACHLVFTEGHEPTLADSCQCLGAGPNVIRPLPRLPAGLEYCKLQLRPGRVH